MSAPIEPQDYLYGTKVVQIEDLRVARGMTRRPVSSCRHRKLVYDNNPWVWVIEFKRITP